MHALQLAEETLAENQQNVEIFQEMRDSLRVSTGKGRKEDHPRKENLKNQA